jgi:hypothetical protein
MMTNFPPQANLGRHFSVANAFSEHGLIRHEFVQSVVVVVQVDDISASAKADSPARCSAML